MSVCLVGALRRSLFFSLAFLTAECLFSCSSAHAISWDDGGLNKQWGNTFNWNPNGSPTGLDVTIGNHFNAANDQTLVDDFYSINSLTITNGADVINSTDSGATNDFELIVNGATSVSGAGSSITIYGGDPDGLDTNTLSIGNGGSVFLNSQSAQGTAVLEVDSGLLDIALGGTLNGSGRIDLEDDFLGAPTTLLMNQGTLSVGQLGFTLGAPTPRTLQITAVDSDARFNWDGPVLSENGIISVRGNGTLDVDVETTDSFSGTMNLSTGATLDMAPTWGFGGGLNVTDGEMNVNTQAFTFIIGQDPAPGPAAHITGAAWTMNGGSINLEDSWDSLVVDSALVASDGTINNNGTITFNSDSTIQSGVDFQMNGDGASLFINAEVNVDTPDFNLDGSANAGNVTTINAGGILDLDLGAGADEDFGHTINMNGGVSSAELDVTTNDNDWGLSPSGEINVAGGGTSEINGETFVVEGDIDIAGNSTLAVGAATQYESTANVTIAAGSVLNHGAVTYSGGSYIGAGLLKKGAATIASDTTWNVATVDLDDGATIIQDGAWLQVNTDSIDDAGDGIDAAVSIANAGFFTVNLGDGSDVVFENGFITYHGDNASNIFLPGSSTGSALRFDTDSNLNVNGDGAASVRIKLNGGALNINNADGEFLLGGGNLVAGNTNEIAGSTVNGPGELQIGSGRALRGNGTIDAPLRGFNSAQLIAEGGTLDINGGILDIGRLGTEGVAAVLDITNAWNTNVADDVILNGGTLQGANIENEGVNGIQGEGVITARVSNNTLLRAKNGTLVVDNPLTDWDGNAETGTLRASSGVLELRDDTPFDFDGSVLASSGTVYANGFSLNFSAGSTLELSKGFFQSTDNTDIAGTVTIGGPSSTIEVTGDVLFESTSSTTLNGDLRLLNWHTEVEAGATFAGVGELVNLSGSPLNLLDTATIGVQITNEGDLDIEGTSVGQANVTGYQQEGTGWFFADLQGTSLGEFDLLLSTGLAQLDGTLAVDLGGVFNPELGDIFTVISAAGGVVGAFATEDFSEASLDAGLTWEVIYNPNNVQLLVVPTLPGDYNFDGTVNAADYTVWRDGNSPDSTSAGYDLWVDNFGNTLPVVAESHSVPEPTSLALASLSFMLVILIRAVRAASTQN